MIFMRLLLLLFFFTVCLNAESLYFPFQKEAFLTSSFGENRGTRYHAGVDYSTNMEEGWVVFAPENGFVEELRISPYSYGKVIYFKGESGRTWVFAHLSGFSKTLDSLVLQTQYQTKKNDVKITPKLQFQKGDTLAFSGSSGIGNPHLHLEMREGMYKLHSPCQNNVACADSIAPFVFAGATWNNHEVKTSLFQSENNFCLEKPISGDSFFVAFKIADYSRTPLENPMSIRRLKISSSTDVLYEKIQDTLSFKDMLKIRTELLFAEEADTAGDWHFIKAAIPSSVDTLLLEVEDFNSNKRTVKTALQNSCVGNVSLNRLLHQDSLLYTFLSRTFVSFKNCLSAVPLLTSQGKVIEQDLCKIYSGQDIAVSVLTQKYPNAKKIAFAKDTVFISDLKGTKKQTFTFQTPKEKITLQLPLLEPRSWPLEIAFRKRQTDSLSYLEFHPKGLHFSSKLKLCVEGNSWKSPLFYLGETTRKWFYFSSQKSKKRERCVTINEVRDIASIADTLPPTLGNPYFAFAIVAGKKDSVIRIPVIETGSGLKNGNAINVFTENREQWIPVEFDSEPNELVLEKRNLPKDIKSFWVTIEDEIGNQATYRVEIPLL